MPTFWSTLDVGTVPPEMLIVAGLVALMALVGSVLAVRRWRRGGARDRAPRRPSAAPPEPSYARMRRGLAKTRAGIFGTLSDVLAGRTLDAAAVESLEAALIRADVGVATTGRLLTAVRARSGDEAVRDRLAAEMRGVLGTPGSGGERAARPHVIMVVGVNGVGKTTSIGKLASREAAAGRRVLLVAADTFRAAASEQLAIWAERSGADLIRQQQGSDPAAVVFDGMRAAVARQSDVVIVDTAGRLHTKSNLMEELKKVRRVIAREIPGAPHETLLTLDATTGQNGLAQARAFVDALEVSGVVLTKLDGTAKGGIVIAIAAELGIPIRYVGVGERVDDLRDFDPAQFVEALLGPGTPEDALDTQHP
jgi:fused signal recognition particle receptor